MIRFDDGVRVDEVFADKQFYQQVRPILDKKNLNDAGETGGLWHANYVLSKRFPKRLRPYLPHVPKAVTRGLHHEAALMFEKDLYISTQRQFRESKRGVGDIQMQWLLISLRVSGELNWAEGRSSDGEKLYCGLLSLPSLGIVMGYSVRMRSEQLTRHWAQRERITWRLSEDLA